MGRSRRFWRFLVSLGLVSSVAGALPVAMAPSASAAIGLPAGFSATVLSSGNIFAPTLFTFTPDGDPLISQQTSQNNIKLLKNGQVTVFLSLNIEHSTDRGVLGIAFDPQFPTSPYVYIYYHRQGPPIHGVISRFTVQGDKALPASERVIYTMDNLRTDGVHTGGVMEFGSDGKLYVSVGDDAIGTQVSQSLGSGLGKMLRINKDGSIPTDNPFYDGGGPNVDAIWARGLRNPFTWAFSGTGSMMIADVGSDTWEELNVGKVGANYGWPTVSGVANDPRFVDPVYAYSHATGTCAVIGGDFSDAGRSTFPALYDGHFFFADFCAGWVKAFDPATKTIKNFGTGFDSPTHLRFGPDGRLYVLTRGKSDLPATLVRIDHTGGSTSAPSIVQQPGDQSVSVGSPATFRVEAQGTAPLSYQWRRNGTPIPGATNPAYTLASAALSDDGATFSVLISNSLGAVTSREARLSVDTNRPPVPTITAPAAGTTYSFGDTINYAATATDPEDGVLPASAFDWKIDFHHDAHEHPFRDPAPGSRTGSFIADYREASANVYYHISLVVTDSRGRTTEVSRDVRPVTTTVQLETLPPGGTLLLDGAAVGAPYSFTGVAKMPRIIAAGSPVTIGGKQWVFNAWSDFGLKNHTVAPSGGTVTYVAVYRLAAGNVGTGRGLRATYFNQVGLTNQVTNRVEPVVMLDVPAARSPAPGVAAGTYSVRWQGQLQGQFTQNYTFSVVADDGVRLWVDGRLLIDQWGPRPRQTYTSVAVPLAAGARVPVKMEFRQGSGRAGFARLFWQSASTPRSIVPSTQLYPPA